MTSVPVPKVLDWSDDSSNSTGTEYIIMEFVEGVRLTERWNTMSTLERLECTETLSNFLADMTHIDFTAYGSLYFIDSPLQDFPKLPYRNDYFIGAQCSAEYWKCGVGDLESLGDSVPNPGPCKYSRLFLLHYAYQMTQGEKYPASVTDSSIPL